MDLSLFDLLAPYVFRGAGGPLWVEALLAALYVDRYETAISDDAVVVTGVAKFNVDVDPPVLVPPFGIRFSGSSGTRHDTSLPRSTAVLDIRDSHLDFRITALRRSDGGVVAAGVGAVAPGAAHPGPALQAIATALGGFTPRTDAPTCAMRTELLFRAVSIRLPGLTPARVDGDGMLVPDPAFPDVCVVLPRILLRHEQDLAGNDRVTLDSFGASSLATAADLGVAELARMEPPYALVGPVFGFGCDRVIVDFSQEHTPPELLAKFSLGDDWQGLYLPDIRLFYAPKGQEWLRFAVAAKDLLIGIQPEVALWGDFSLDVLNKGEIRADVKIAPPDAAMTTVASFEGEGPHQRSGLSMVTGSALVIDVDSAAPPYAVSVEVRTRTGEVLKPARRIEAEGQRLVIEDAGDLTFRVVITEERADGSGHRLTADLHAMVLAAPALPAKETPAPPRSSGRSRGPRSSRPTASTACGGSSRIRAVIASRSATPPSTARS